MNKSKLRYCVYSLLLSVHENVDIFAKRTSGEKKKNVTGRISQQHGLVKMVIYREVV